MTTNCRSGTSRSIFFKLFCRTPRRRMQPGVFFLMRPKPKPPARPVKPQPQPIQPPIIATFWGARPSRLHPSASRRRNPHGPGSPCALACPGRRPRRPLPLFGERGCSDRIRRRPTDGIFQPKLARLLGESASILLMIRGASRIYRFPLENSEPKDEIVTGRLKTGHLWALQNRPLQSALFISGFLIQARDFPILPICWRNVASSLGILASPRSTGF